jgi:magnesium-transporting ATPase (P-type)
MNHIEKQQLKMTADVADVADAPMYLEKGKLPEGESNKMLDDALFESYLELRRIAELHPESRVDLANVEKSAGLLSKEAAKRLITYGKNSLSSQNSRMETCSLVAYFLTKDITNLYLAIVLAVVVFMTGYAQYHEESKAYKIVDSFSRMLATTCTVIRDTKQ